MAAVDAATGVGTAPGADRLPFPILSRGRAALGGFLSTYRVGPAWVSGALRPLYPCVTMPAVPAGSGPLDRRFGQTLEKGRIANGLLVGRRRAAHWGPLWRYEEATPTGTVLEPPGKGGITCT